MQRFTGVAADITCATRDKNVLHATPAIVSVQTWNNTLQICCKIVAKLGACKAIRYGSLQKP